MNAMQALAAPSFIDETPAFIKFSNAAESYRRAKKALQTANGNTKSPDIQLQILELAAAAKMDEHRTASALDVAVGTIRTACKRLGVNLSDNVPVKIKGLEEGMKAFRDFVSDAQTGVEEVKEIQAPKAERLITAAPMPDEPFRKRANKHEARAATHAAVRDAILATGKAPSKSRTVVKTGLSHMTVAKHWPTDTEIEAMEDEFLALPSTAATDRKVVKLSDASDRRRAAVLEAAVLCALDNNPLYREGKEFDMPVVHCVEKRVGMAWATVKNYWPTEEAVRSGMDESLARHGAFLERLRARDPQALADAAAAEAVLGPDPFGDILYPEQKVEREKAQSVRYEPPVLQSAVPSTKKTDKEIAEQVAKMIHGEDFVEGTYLDEDGNYQSDRLVNTGEGFKPQVRAWRLHLDTVEMVLGVHKIVMTGQF